MRCPGCEQSNFDLLVSRDRIALEIELRRQFFAHRMDGHVDPEEQKDRVDVAHGSSAELLICRTCGILARNEDQSPHFEEDRYADFVMERMLRAHIEAYRSKESRYKALLPERARVVEVGSYVGGFLHVAKEWGWNAVGVDVGVDTAHFSRAHGYATRNETLEECRFDDASFDGVFIWNCFEQIADPKRLLREVHRIIKPGGALVILTPNARFYLDCETRLRNETGLTDHHPIVIALGHANLLGFPHLYGYGAESLDRIVTGFTLLHHAFDRHIMPALRPLTATATREGQQVPADSWLEAAYRA